MRVLLQVSVSLSGAAESVPALNEACMETCALTFSFIPLGPKLMHKSTEAVPSIESLANNTHLLQNVKCYLVRGHTFD